METTDLRPRVTPTGNGAPARVARKKFDPTQLFAQRDRLPWFWFFVAVAVTGFAGPAGEACEEGLVHFAIATKGGNPQHRVEHFGAIGRGPVRVKALEAMLEMLESALERE